ncbi:hypothetical protein J4225_04890 [Candidatus Pacearchaeota archaeon]|nr:hypothetical protein [Candidatus Pacearchaeota archaeon]
MSIKKELLTTLVTIKDILSNSKYFGITIITSVVAFAVLYYFMLATVADMSLRIAVDMSGASYIYGTIASIILLSGLFGIYLSLIVYKFSFAFVGRKGLFGIGGGFIGALGVGCPTCGALLLGLFGAPLALMYFPFQGAELRIAGIIILAFSVHFIAKSIDKSCKLS